MINNLSSLLERFKHIKNPKEERGRLAELLSKEVGFDFKESDLEIKKQALVLKVDGYLKTEVFMNRDLILNKIKEAGFDIFEIK